MKRTWCLVLIVLVSSAFAYGASDEITTAEAKNYVDKYKTVRGTVVSTKYAYGSRGRPTFLSLDKPYPAHIFTVVIWGSDRQKFKSPPEKYYKGKKIRVTGLIKTYKGTPQIVVRRPSQIVLVESQKDDTKDNLQDSHTSPDSFLDSGRKRTAERIRGN